MSDFTFSARTTLAFDQPVREHHVEFRSAPCLSSSLDLRRVRVTVEPSVPVRVRRDAWGNLRYAAEIPGQHQSWSYRVEGAGRWTGRPDPRVEGDAWCSQPGALTGWGPALQDLADRWTLRSTPDPFTRRWSLTRLLATHLRYSPGVTGPHTPAAQAASLGAGVCQDWAQIYLCLWRHAGGLGRYVAGWADRTGTSHGWVELAWGGLWRPWDPLREQEALVGYIPVARGRDAHDCSFNRGVFRGSMVHQTLAAEARLEVGEGAQ